jgi:hypothetical protein
MKFERIENDKIIFSTELYVCSCCDKPMIVWYDKVSPSTLVGIGIVIESYVESGICTNCVKAGGFLKTCNCCGKDHVYPDEFKYQITHYAEHTDDEASFEYICFECIKDNTDRVIDMLVESDNTIVMDGRK